MWQTPSKKARSSGKTGSIRNPRSSRGQARIRLRRAHAQVKILAMPGSSTSIMEARLLLNEVSPNGLSLFCATSLPVGSEIAVTLEEPARIYVRGRIVSCLEYESSQHVLSQQSFHFRVGIMFLFDTPAERADFKKFCDSLASGYIGGAQPAPEKAAA